MPSGHFGLAGAYVVDPTAASQRAHRERESAMALQERSERWLCSKMRGMSYDSLEDLADAALAITAEHYDRKLSDTETTLIVRAANALWMGFVDASYFKGKISITRGERIEFLAAA